MVLCNYLSILGKHLISACRDKCVVTAAILFSLFSCIGGFMRFIAYDLSFSFVTGLFIVLYSLFVGLLTLILCPVIERFCKSDTNICSVSFPKTFFGAFFLIVLFALPTLIAFYPGTIGTDAYIELCYASHISKWIAHYSVPVDVLMLKILNAGRSVFKNDNLALFLFNGTQFFAQTIIFSYAYYVLAKMNSRRFVRIFALMIFALQPSLRMWGYTMCKDTMYAMCILLLMTVILDMNVSLKSKWYHIALLVFSTLVIVISRKNGIYVIALFSAFGVIQSKKRLRFLIIASTAICALIILKYSEIHYNVEPGYVREALSVPIQQTARYITYHFDELSNEELDVIRQVYIVSPKEIASLYDAEVSDPVKFMFIERPTDEQLSSFFKMWVKMLCKHPETYITAFISNTYGYLDLTKTNFWGGTNGVYIIDDSYKWQGPIAFNFYLNPTCNELRNFIEAFHNRLSTLFPVSVFYCCGIYSYILIYCFLKQIRDKNLKNFYILVLGFGSLLFCMLSPVNALIRYAEPIWEIAPLLVAYSGRTGTVSE